MFEAVFIKLEIIVRKDYGFQTDQKIHHRRLLEGHRGKDIICIFVCSHVLSFSA